MPGLCCCARLALVVVSGLLSSYGERGYSPVIVGGATLQLWWAGLLSSYGERASLHCGQASPCVVSVVAEQGL